jgi:2-phospho-L-lactate guanylyltransferase
VQATSYRYDADTRTGSVVADDGVVLPFDAAALDASGLRHLRPGQRLTVRLDPAGRRVVALALGTIGALDRVEPEPEQPQRARPPA